jgi:hypothetical protein
MMASVPGAVATGSLVSYYHSILRLTPSPPLWVLTSALTA